MRAKRASNAALILSFPSSSQSSLAGGISAAAANACWLIPLKMRVWRTHFPMCTSMVLSNFCIGIPLGERVKLNRIDATGLAALDTDHANGVVIMRGMTRKSKGTTSGGCFRTRHVVARLICD
jgi:hypothetical protein